MANKGRSDPNPFGGYTNYDEKGKRSGRTEPDLFGGYTTYDSKGGKSVEASPICSAAVIRITTRMERRLAAASWAFSAATPITTQTGIRLAASEPNFFGGYTSYDTNGHKTGSSDPSPFSAPINPTSPASNSSTSNGEGCYIATCVYGSYDAPEVLTLRRFRDEILKKHRLGRAFIRCYYAISPHLVKCFGKSEWFHRFWRKRLDGMVAQFEHNLH